MKNILITGVAGFIGAYVANTLLARGHRVTGIDNLNCYYSTALKNYRLKWLTHYPNFEFIKTDLAELPLESKTFEVPKFSHVVHLAGQAGVRYSIDNPEACKRSNIDGFNTVLAWCRQTPPDHFIFASSSSVYGNSHRSFNKEGDATDSPLSLYAITKKQNEILGYEQSVQEGIPTTGLRLFSVYGPAGRPDMAYFKFTKAILENKTISVYNNGQHERDFTYIDDIVEGITSTIDHPPTSKSAPFRTLNLGSGRPVALEHFISTLEDILGKAAIKHYLDIQPGDVLRTSANIEAAQQLINFSPSTTLQTGLENFAAWYKTTYRQIHY